MRNGVFVNPFRSNESVLDAADNKPFKVGQKVKFVSGLYSGGTGHIESINENTGRVVVRGDNKIGTGYGVSKSEYSTLSILDSASLDDAGYFQDYADFVDEIIELGQKAKKELNSGKIGGAVSSFIGTVIRVEQDPIYRKYHK